MLLLYFHWILYNIKLGETERIIFILNVVNVVLFFNYIGYGIHAYRVIQICCTITDTGSNLSLCHMVSGYSVLHIKLLDLFIMHKTKHFMSFRIYILFQIMYIISIYCWICWISHCFTILNINVSVSPLSLLYSNMILMYIIYRMTSSLMFCKQFVSCLDTLIFLFLYWLYGWWVEPFRNNWIPRNGTMRNSRGAADNTRLLKQWPVNTGRLRLFLTGSSQLEMLHRYFLVLGAKAHKVLCNSGELISRWGFAQLS